MRSVTSIKSAYSPTKNRLVVSDSATTSPTIVARAESPEAMPAATDAEATSFDPVPTEQSDAMQALAAPIDDPESSASDGLATPGSGFAGLLSRYRSTDEARTTPVPEASNESESLRDDEVGSIGTVVSRVVSSD